VTEQYVGAGVSVGEGDTVGVTVGVLVSEAPTVVLGVREGDALGVCDALAVGDTVPYAPTGMGTRICAVVLTFPIVYDQSVVFVAVLTSETVEPPARSGQHDRGVTETLSSHAQPLAVQ
jgi:hypothetical protein